MSTDPRSADSLGWFDAYRCRHLAEKTTLEPLVVHGQRCKLPFWHGGSHEYMVDPRWRFEWTSPSQKS